MDTGRNVFLQFLQITDNKWPGDNLAYLDVSIHIVHTQYLISETVNAVGVNKCITVALNGTIWENVSVTITSSLS